MENSHDEYLRIKEFLKDDPRGMNIRQISEGLKINRNSVAKYLDILATQEEVEVRVSGKSKIFNLSQKIPLSGLLRFSANWIIILNSDMRVVQINEAFRAYSRLHPDKILHRKIMDIPLIPCTHPSTIELARKALAGNETHGELSIPAMDRQSFLRLTATPTAFQDHSAGIILVFEDITEKKKYEAALKNSEEKFRSLVETSADWIWEVDGRGKFTYSSPQVRDILGYEPEEMIGKSPFDLMPPEEAARVSWLVRHAAAANQPLRAIENINIHQDGHTIVYLETSGRPFFDKSGALAGYRGIDRDITERKRTESLRGEYQFLQQLIDIIPNPVYYKDTRGIYQGCNKAFEAFIGKKKEDIIGKSAYDLFSRELAEMYTQKDREIFRSAGTQVYEYVLSHSDGTDRNVIFYRAAYTESHGEVLGIVGIVVDFTERKRAEEALRESEERYRTVFENTGTAMLIIEPDTTISLANSQFERLSGYSRLEIEGRMSWTPFVAAEDLARMVDQHRLRRESDNHALTQYEFWFISRSGEARKIFINIDMIPGTKKSVASLMDITDRIAAEIQLKRSEERYRLLLQNVNDGVIVHDLTPDGPGQIRTVNDRICQLLGYTQDELQELSIRDIDIPEQSEKAHTITDRIRAHGQAVFETDLVTKTRERIPVEISARLFELQNRSLILAIVRDITERRRAEQALKESEIQLANAMELAGLAKWELDIASGIYTFDNRFYALYSTTAEREGGNHMPAETYFREFVHPEDVQNITCQVRQTLDGNPPESLQFEHRIIRRDGEVRTVLVRTRIIKDAEGRMVKIFGANQDITDRKRVEEALQKSEERFRLLLQNVPSIAIQGYNIDGTTQYWNAASESLYGFTAEEAIGKNLIDLIIPQEMKGEVRQLIHEMEKTGQPLPASEVLLQRKDGSRVATYSHHALVRSSSGDLELFCMDVDLSERKQAEEALRQANLKLNLLSGITRHDIKNQLLALSMYIYLVEESLDDQEKLEQYLESQKQIVNTITHQISFTKEYEELGLKDPAWQNIRRLVSLAARQIPMDRITVDEGDPALELYANLLLEKVFFNLLDNAVQHGGDRLTEIKIRTVQQNGTLIIRVEDNGKGIAASDKELIFSKNFGANTGLGLYLTREILSITGISISETGTEGHGACFELHVPEGMYRFTNPSVF